MGADLGELIVGRKGSPTRFQFSLASIQTFIGLQVPGTAEADEFAEEIPEADNRDTGEPLAEGTTATKRELGQAIFITHGKNKKPVEQQKKDPGRVSDPVQSG